MYRLFIVPTNCRYIRKTALYFCLSTFYKKRCFPIETVSFQFYTKSLRDNSDLMMGRWETIPSQQPDTCCLIPATKILKNKKPPGLKQGGFLKIRYGGYLRSRPDNYRECSTIGPECFREGLNCSVQHGSRKKATNRSKGAFSHEHSIIPKAIPTAKCPKKIPRAKQGGFLK